MSPVTRNVMLHEFTVMVKANADALISRRRRKVPHPPPKDGVGLSLPNVDPPQGSRTMVGRRDSPCPSCDIELRASGAYNFHMRGPEGDDHWSRGIIREFVEPDISRITILRSSRYRARRYQKSKHTRSGWDGSSTGCHPAAATSTTTSMYRSPRRRWRRARSIT